MTDSDHYRISEVAEHTGRSVHTIRWYEAQGLVPSVARDDGGRRVYRAEHLEWFDLLARLQSTGMSIAEMRRYTALVVQGPAALEERRDLLETHRQRVVEKITDLKSALTAIDNKIEFYREWLANGQRPKALPTGDARPVARSSAPRHSSSGDTPTAAQRPAHEEGQAQGSPKYRA